MVFYTREFRVLQHRVQSLRISTEAASAIAPTAIAQNIDKSDGGNGGKLKRDFVYPA